MAKRKRKVETRSASSEPSVKRKRTSTFVCVLHNPTIPKDNPFTCFSSVKCLPSDKLLDLHKIRDRRLTEPIDSPYRMKDVCDLLPESLEGLDLEKTGYHRRCYQLFTMHLNRLKTTSLDSSTAPSTSQRHHSPRKHVSADANRIIFPADQCLFCEKNEVKVGGNTQRPTRSFAAWKTKDSGWQKIESMADALGKTSLKRKVKGIDLFAAEAHYHDVCYHRFFCEYQNYKHKLKNDESDTMQTRKIAAHTAANNVVKELLKTQVIDNGQAMSLRDLRERYIIELDAQGEPSYAYRSAKLKAKLEKDEELRRNLSFSKVNLKGCCSLWLVYSSRSNLADVLASTYRLGTADQLKNTALYLRRVILKAFKESADLPWPPTADELANRAKDELPEELKMFLNMVLFGCGPEVGTCERTCRLVYSIGEDLCRAVTSGRWKLSKHLLLCTTVRHLYRSKQLTTILHRLGHCESYDFGLELETAMTKALDEHSTYLTPNIICGPGNAVFHSEWDNLNKITTNIHGPNVVKSAGGIMIQEIAPNVTPNTERTLPIYDRSKARSLKVDTPETLPPVTIYNRDSPKFPENASFSPPDDEPMAAILREYYVWLLCRMISSKGKQEVPALAGFISATGATPTRKSTIDYYTPINQPITQYETVMELLQRSEEATRSVGQKYTINTFDLGVCMKALPLVWKYPDQFKDHVIIPGPFHTSMNFIGMITNHKCLGSGYAEILMESQLVTSGCLKSVLSGKAYAKALFCLKTVCEALERLLLDVFIEEMNIQICPAALLDIMKSCLANTSTSLYRIPRPSPLSNST